MFFPAPSTHFLLFIDASGKILVYEEQGLLKLPRRTLSPVSEILAEIAPHSIVLAPFDITPSVCFNTMYQGELHEIEIFRIPVDRNGAGIWIDLHDCTCRNTNCIIDEMRKRLPRAV